ncbi:hypothetical protein QLX08_003307 [Tetragonisca angustula]|uniref:Serpin domain-containing protein n=1 Tax=Tetragonisca angustula TaxID=166442 RepID=A0AAW1A6W8_9HYME
MAITLIILSLAATCFGQLIYPDDKLLQATTVSPNYFAYSQLQSSSSRLRPPSAILASQPAPQNTLEDWKSHVNDIIVNGVLKFALDLDREIYKTRNTSLIEQQDNIVFSPISLTVALALILAGSAGRTFNEVSKVLGLESGVDISRNSEIVHQMFGMLTRDLQRNRDTEIPRLDFATAIYVQDGYPILQQFKALSEGTYQTEVFNVDFARNGKATQDVINKWVWQKTMGKISNILGHPPGPQTTLILLSALYFKGEWNQYFIDGATKRRQFFVEPNKAIDVDMMYNGGTFPFYEDKQLGVKILGLPYKGREVSMYVLLPTEEGAKALREFENRLTVDIIENLIKNTKNETCIIGFPRMKLSSSLSLKRTLAALGLESLFNPATADLSLISQPNINNINNKNPMNMGLSGSLARPAMQPQSVANGDRMVTRNPQSYEDRVYFPSRFDEGRMVKRNYFTYEDKTRSYAVHQWANGFNLRKIRDTHNAKGKQDRNSYTMDDKSEGNHDNAKIVNLEENKYRFQGKGQARSKRQSRPIDQNFLNLMRQLNLPSYGLDNLRNSANLVNPHLFAADVLQKVEIDITEKGTEAAAVTSVVLERDGNQKKFIARRPFIFFIRHDPSRLVLFWGTLNVPTPNYPPT